MPIVRATVSTTRLSTAGLLRETASILGSFGFRTRGFSVLVFEVVEDCVAFPGRFVISDRRS